MQIARTPYSASRQRPAHPVNPPLGGEAPVAEPGDSYQPSTPAPAGQPSDPVKQPSVGPERLSIAASPDVSPADLARLRQTADTAIAYFEENFGPVTSPVRFEVGKASSALRTGYNFVDDVICLPQMETVRNAGLDSVDVINHEIFHALMVKAYPHLPVDDMASSGSVCLHEALADLFAHRLQPDRHFGENYYLEKDAVREYHTSLRLGLTAGSHAQGNAITALLLAQGVENHEIRSFLEAGDFSVEGLAAVSPALGRALAAESALLVGEQITSSHPHSRRGSYWLSPDKSLELTFQPNSAVLEEHPDFRVVWLDKNGIPSRKYTFTPSGEHAFAISGAPDADAEKVIARFYDGDRVIGFRPYYFGVREAVPSQTEP